MYNFYFPLIYLYMSVTNQTTKVIQIYDDEIRPVSEKQMPHLYKFTQCGEFREVETVTKIRIFNSNA